MSMQKFVAKIGADKKVHLPQNLVSKLDLKNNDLLSVRVVQNKIFIHCYAKVFACNRQHRKPEYLMVLRNRSICGSVKSKIFVEKSGVLLMKKEQSEKYIFAQELFENPTQLGKDSVLIFYGRSMPLIIPRRIKLEDVALYLGCYFADGTKRGSYWRITASTFEQAKFYMKMHKLLIKNPKIKFRLTYSNKACTEPSILKIRLKKAWKASADINIPENRIKILRTISAEPKKWNPYGALDIINNGLGVLIFYNKVMHLLIERIIKTQNKVLAMDFICGVLEGDGTVNAKKRGHVQIATNNEDYPILLKLLITSGIKHAIVKEGNNIFIRIGALEILRNFHALRNKIFMFYPKRKKVLADRLNTVGGIRYITGEQNYASSWVKAELRRMRILNANYALTMSGKRMKSDLLEFQKSVTVK